MRRCSRCDHSSWHEPAGARRGGRTACPHRLDVDENDRIAAYACAYARPLTSDQHSRTLGLEHQLGCYGGSAMSGASVGRIGTVIGERFRLDELIGRGAMAEVYRALDVTTSAYVAVKIMRHTHLTDATSRARFPREAEVQARLRHRNVAALLATGLTDKQEPYLAVELL